MRFAVDAHRSFTRNRDRLPGYVRYDLGRTTSILESWSSDVRWRFLTQGHSCNRQVNNEAFPDRWGLCECCVQSRDPSVFKGSVLSFHVVNGPGP